MTMTSESLRDQVAMQLRRLREEGVWGLDVSLHEPDDLPAAAPVNGIVSLQSLAAQADVCTECTLCSTRNRVVFGVGDPRAPVMFIGEGPGHDEDLQGEPFVGRAGAVLDRIIVAMGLTREAVYITNTVKCRPPRNCDPEPAELDACRHFLLRQVEIVQPRVIVLLGRVAAQAVLQVSSPLGALRGRWQEWQGIPVMCTYHPAYLLRKPQDKRKTWSDIQAVMRLLDGDK